MINEFVREIQSQLLQMFPQNQIRDITGVIVETSKGYSIQKNEDDRGKTCCNEEWLKRFLSSKSVEGCSSKTISYYENTIRHVLGTVNKPIVSIYTDDLRTYLYDYQKQRGSSKITIDNIRRILSSFFSWLEDEELIIRSPVRRIHKIKTGRVVKDTFSDEDLEVMRDACVEARDLALIDVLSSTGMRVGELVNLNRSDINFNERECIVFGKGDAEREVYFDARSKLHLQNYLGNRNDSNDALFVSLKKAQG